MFAVNVPYFWTSGRLCDFDGCDRPDFFPKNINGWFWSANQARLAPTDSKSAFHDWSATGGWVKIIKIFSMFPEYFCLKYFLICRFNPPRAQPDNREETQQGGETESCMAVLNNFYGDGATRIFSKILKYLTKIFQASNGTMLLATTRSRSSARMWRATSPSPGRPSPTSGSPERGAAASNTIYLFIWKTVFVS